MGFPGDIHLITGYAGANRRFAPVFFYSTGDSRYIPIRLV